MILLFLLPLLLLVYYYYRRTVPQLEKGRRTLLFCLRAISVAILLLLIFNPILNFKRNIQSPPLTLFLYDNSESMDLPHNSIESKEEHSKAAGNKLEEIAKQAGYQVKKFNFADGIEGAIQNTSLNKTLSDLANKVDLTQINSMFLLSDGWFNDDDLEIINRFNTPVFTLNVDYQSEESGVGIKTIFHNQTAYTDEENSFLVDLFAENYTGSAETEFYVNDVIVGRQKVDFSHTKNQQVNFTHTFLNAGLHTFRAEVKIKEETQPSTGNNIYPGAIKVLESRSGIYILTDKLTWDVRYLTYPFMGDDRKIVKTFRLKNGNLYQGANRVEFADLFEEQLQLLVLNNQNDLKLNSEQLKLVERFVGNGGGLIQLGRPLDELYELTGIKESNVELLFRSTLNLTPESKQYQTFQGLDIKSIPPVDYYYVNTSLQAKVLAQLDNKEKSPALVFQQYKKGRSLSFAFHNLWRWQLRSADDQYSNFIQNITAWLSSTVDNSFTAQTNKNSYLLGEPITIKLIAYDEKLAVNRGLSPKLTIRTEDKKTVYEDFLLFEGEDYQKKVETLPSGNYRYEIQDVVTGYQTEGSFIVSEFGIEAHHKGYNQPLLTYLAKQTGGETIFEDRLSDFHLPKAEIQTIVKRYEIPLYRHWLTISLFLVSFCLELYLRRKWGLL